MITSYCCPGPRLRTIEPALRRRRGPFRRRTGSGRAVREPRSGPPRRRRPPDAATDQQRARIRPRPAIGCACAGAMFWPTFWITRLMSRAFRRMRCSRTTTSGSTLMPTFHDVHGVVQNVVDRQRHRAVNRFDAGGGGDGLLGGQQFQRVERHRHVAGENLEELQIAVGEGVEFGAFDVERADHLLVQHQRHGERAAGPLGTLPDTADLRRRCCRCSSCRSRRRSR